MIKKLQNRVEEHYTVVVHVLRSTFDALTPLQKTLHTYSVLTPTIFPAPCNSNPRKTPVSPMGSEHAIWTMNPSIRILKTGLVIN